MGIRDIVIVAVLALGTVVALGRPWIGGLTWTWIGLMNPHRLAWAIRDWPVAQGVAASTLIGLILSRERRAPPLMVETVMLGGLAVYFCLTTALAWNPGASVTQLEKVLKIYLFVFVMMMLFYERTRIRWLMAVTIGSVGFFGVKGGLFAVLSGGEYRIWGPPGSFIADNNALGLALSMILPMAFYAARAERHNWFGVAYYAVFWLSIPAILFTYSRGALLGLVAALFVVFWRYSKVGLLAFFFCAGAFVYFGQELLPEQWVARQQSTINYEEDDSAMQRIQAWGVAINVAIDRPLLGAGFDLPYAKNDRWLSYANFLGDWENGARAAHSIWFQVLGQHGFLAFFMFIAMFGMAWWRLGHVAKVATKGDAAWVGLYARGAQLALVPYAVSGTFLSLAYFDLAYYCIVFSVILHRYYLEMKQDESVSKEHTVAKEASAGVSA